MSKVQETVTCPYNVSHQILKVRMPKHLIKCRKQHPISFFETCPFNTTHDVPETEFEYHIKTCPDRRKLDNYLYVIGDSKPNDIPINVEIPPSVENWDEEEVQSVSYVDYKERNLENKMIMRTPVGLTKSQRRAFFQDEVLRFQRVSSSMKSNNGGKSISSVTKYPAAKKVKHSTMD